MMITPQAEVMAEQFTGRPMKGNRAPVLSKLEFEGGGNARLAKPGEPMSVNFAAEDPDKDTVEFLTWILDSTAKKTTTVAGPFPNSSPEHVEIKAPKNTGEYLLLVYAKDKKGGASASTIAFKVSDEETGTPATPGEPAQP